MENISNKQRSSRITPSSKSRSKDKLTLASTSKPAVFQLGRDQGEFKPPENWANAPEFVPSWLSSSSEGKNDASITPPKPRSYAAVVGTSNVKESESLNTNDSNTINTYWEEFCPYNLLGECRFGDQCLMLHGLKCDYCGEFCLHPYDSIQRSKHSKECVAEHEKDMELSFAIARSADKTCGVCYEKVMSKEPSSEQRFGILPSCNHCFCLSCIRRWRQARQFENKIIRACPECRVTSDFICPSRYWVDSKEDKDKLIGCYKVALSQKPCRYYRSGEGQCPFGNKCFYKHALANGQEVDVGPPRRIMGSEGQVPSANLNQNNRLWDFIEDWEFQWLDFEDLMEFVVGDTGIEDDLDFVDETFDYWRT